MKTEMIVTTKDLRGEIHSESRPDGTLFEFQITRGGGHVFAGHGFTWLADAMMALQRAMVDLLQEEAA
jgi:hypothetical protein